ncbi:ATP-binding protein [Desulfotignum balticum]|uniref:ATP-binding protein n=1 Tax=Desulfotignum balticum TaxID=115781 RepID=UPI000403166F|nr:ATP-binding protein [Desulfotignum balticum]
MAAKRLFKRDFMYEADQEKGFKKLRDNQFPIAEQGLVYEPLANALDQQTGKTPIVVTFRKQGDGYWLRFKDDGQGLTLENLTALHYIGKSTKREELESNIGRFGMGIAGAFHTRLGVTRAEIKTCVCGEPSRIVYDCSTDQIPLWWIEPLKRQIRGMVISFYIGKKAFYPVEVLLKTILSKMIRPVRYNGVLYRYDPEKPPEGNTISILSSSNPRVYYHAILDNSIDTFCTTDDVRIYLRDMPVEEGEMYWIFVSSAGDKMPQNFWGRPYMTNEVCTVLDTAGEPTVGRDKVVRNQAFDVINQAVQTARARALETLIARSLSEKENTGLVQMTGHMVLANLYTLREQVKTVLKNEALPEDKQYLSPLTNALVEYRVFPVFECRDLLSLRQIFTTRTPGNVLFFAENDEAAGFLSGCHECPFILKEYSYLFSGLWGGHKKKRIETVLQTILDDLKSHELILLDKLMWDDEKIEELEQRQVIQQPEIRISIAKNPAEPFMAFLDSLRDLLNRPWFREAVSCFRPPRRIILRPIQVETSPRFSEVVAGVLNTGNNPNELAIGINAGSSAIGSLLRHPKGSYAFLPILCHELAHRRQTLVLSKNSTPHGQAFYIDRMRLEDRVLQGCVRHLLGKEMDGTAADHEDIMVL